MSEFRCIPLYPCIRHSIHGHVSITYAEQHLQLARFGLTASSSCTRPGDSPCRSHWCTHGTNHLAKTFRTTLVTNDLPFIDSEKNHKFLPQARGHDVGWLALMPCRPGLAPSIVAVEQRGSRTVPCETAIHGFRVALAGHCAHLASSGRSGAVEFQRSC